MKKKPAKKTKSVTRRSAHVVRLHSDPEWRKQHQEWHEKEEARALDQMDLIRRFVVAFERIAYAMEKGAKL